MPKLSKQKKSIKTEKKTKTLFQSPKGMHDILPEEQPYWERIKKIGQEIADFYNFSRIDTPIIESAEIFEKSIGAATDIVEKQMFYLKSLGKDKLALRPEGTAGIVRAYLEHGLSKSAQPLKLYYFGPMFRYESPQAGRYRQFHQAGFEIIGSKDDPVRDAQVILAGFRLIEELKIKNLNVGINSIGCKNCRLNYRKKLQDYYKKTQNEICRDCKRRLILNPLRLLDCKNEICQPAKAGAPIILNHLCSLCKSHFRGVLEYLDELGLSYVLNPYLVRGFDYYNRTIFEFLSESHNLSLGGGGRYDGLAEMLGAKHSLQACGSGLGVERLIETMKSQGIKGFLKNKPKVFLAHIGQPAKKRAVWLIEEFRKGGVKIIESFGRESLKSQLRAANKEDINLALILGQKEVFEDSVIIKDMKSGSQETVPLSKAVEQVKKRIH
ncbi:histidine--tRNA ligase [Candidatus Wolfebacteria bacterium CG03_land_8_20_14_0_80_40_12]|uniref:Histidine--tRNA ligase n=1 Tax=Candidatus Wolfebacteria bacterium CG03_land_8_20_14_0_80_40_12 TaxID=1975069 RepID=A0A2M7B5H8_9BACT|nr:MAG: histidine--tRNA ligase [Candidatus Wolfebacteria bacterium CG03_land_8_20_14_0_80_40_12]